MNRGRAHRAKFVFAAGVALCLVVGASLASGCAGRAVAAGPSSPPPAARQVQVEYRPGYVWIDGRWTWSSGQWLWQPGYWTRARPGYHYRPGRWENRGGRYVYVEGAWRRGERPTSRDYRRAVRDARRASSR